MADLGATVAELGSISFECSTDWFVQFSAAFIKEIARLGIGIEVAFGFLSLLGLWALYIFEFDTVYIYGAAGTCSFLASLHVGKRVLWRGAVEEEEEEEEEERPVTRRRRRDD